MTSLWNKTVSRLGFKADRSERYVALARLSIFWERLWPAFWPASGIIGLFSAAALFDLFPKIPAGVHLLALFFTALVAGSFLHRGLRGNAFPSWEEGARRLERDSRLSHRPITEGNDRLAAGSGDPWAEQLWRAHLRRRLASAVRLRLKPPSPGLPSRDPYAMRFAILGLVLAGFVAAGPDWAKRLALGFTPDAADAVSGETLDAWIDPPAYTGEAPLYLQHPADGEIVAVPKGSLLVLRVHDAHGVPHLILDPQPQDATAGFSGANGEYGAQMSALRDDAVRVLSGGKLLARLRLKAIPDTPPVIAFSRPPSKTEHDAVKISFTAADDYGVVSARAIIRPAAKKSRAVTIVDLPLPAASARTLSQTVYRDLTGEPLAGVDVDIVLEAKDGAGHSGFSKPARMRLPARVFANPLSRALVEQRQILAVDAPDARKKVARTLDALAIAPDRFYDNAQAAYLAIRTAYWSVLSARGPDEMARLQQLLWDAAVALEQGGLLAAAEQTRQLQQLIEQALAQGAPQDVIDALLDRYRNALQRYLEALAQNAPKSDNTLASGARAIAPQDLDALIEAIQRMAQTGSREAAAQALAMLQSLVENLHVTAGAGQGAPQDKALGDAIQGLGDMIGRQRELLDKTYRQGQGAGDPRDGGGKGLAQTQGKLRRDLDKIVKGLGAGKTPHTLNDAEHAMGDAENRLGSNDFDNAGQSQKNALQALRDTADALAKRLLEESGQSGNSGEAGNDPLGRSEGTNGLAAGQGTRIPDHDALARARSILEELRRRAAERSRPKEELDYYDRLLKEF